MSLLSIKAVLAQLGALSPGLCGRTLPVISFQHGRIAVMLQSSDLGLIPSSFTQQAVCLEQGEGDMENLFYIAFFNTSFISLFKTYSQNPLRHLRSS